MKKPLKSRIFLSCGQNPEERKIADTVKAKLEREYEVYIATEEHKSEGFIENIFHHLENSEYFLFIDFKREALMADGKQAGFRGSLFSNQELALASYLGLDILPFQEKGVEEHRGIMQFVMTNPIPFDDRKTLPDKILAEIKSNWETGWRNQLRIFVSDQVSHVKRYGDKDRASLWFHLLIRNQHRSKQALNCTGFVMEVCPENGGNFSPELSEFKWKGMAYGQSVVIPPEKERKLDAFHIFDDEPDTIVLGINPFLVDSSATEDEYTFKGPGKFRVRYRVYSDNFNYSEANVTVELDNTGGRHVHFGNEEDGSNFKFDYDDLMRSTPVGSTTSLQTFDVTNNFVKSANKAELPVSTDNHINLDPGDYKIKNEAFTGSLLSSVHISQEAGTIGPRTAIPIYGNRSCPSCGAALAYGTNRCTRCGHVLNYQEGL